MNYAPTVPQDRIDKDKKAAKFLEELGIPIIGFLVSMSDGDFRCVRAVDLYDILSDEEKLRKVVSTFKLKAFW